MGKIVLEKFKEFVVGDLVRCVDSEGAECLRGTRVFVISQIYQIGTETLFNVQCCAMHISIESDGWFAQRFVKNQPAEAAALVAVTVDQSQLTLSSQLCKLIFIAKTIGYSEAEKVLRELVKEIKKRG